LIFGCLILNSCQDGDLENELFLIIFGFKKNWHSGVMQDFFGDK